MKPNLLSSRAKYAVALSLVLAGCPQEAKKDGAGSGSPSATAKTTAAATTKATATATATASAATAASSTATPTAAAAGDTFFAGEIPASVKVKAINASTMDNGALLFKPVESWSGGGLPGNDYMAMSKDQQAVFRVYTSTGVTGSMGCKELGTALAMAPAKIKNVTEVKAAAMIKAGKNGFAAMEGECAGEGPKGPAEVHFLNIARESEGSVWQYAVIISFPKDAPAELKDEARVYARSLEFSGRNGYKLP